MIRKDKTNYNQNTDQNNWSNKMYQNDLNREDKLQDDLIKSWATIYSSKDASKIAEYELARRISEASEADTIVTRRAHDLKLLEVAKRTQEKLRESVHRGQNEDEYEEEQEEFGNRYRRALRQAIAEVNKNG